MLTMRKILVPVDFSERSTAAGKHAVALAQRFDAALSFLHVIPPVRSQFAAFEGALYATGLDLVDEETVTERTRRLECLAKTIAPGRAVETVVVVGDPGWEISEFAKSGGIDLIVMPTHGYGPFRRFILGSVTAKVLHDVNCPVFTGTHVPDLPTGDPRPYHRIACALDLSKHSETVLRWGSEFAAAYQAEMVVIHAAPSLDVSGRGGQYLGPEWRGVLLKSARERADKLLEKVGCRAEIYVDTADVADFVSEAAAEAGADLLLVGRSAHNGLIGRLRTHAYALIRESPCPVISV